MSQRPQWQVDTQTAHRECCEMLDKWQAKISRLRQEVDQSDEFTPEALRESVMKFMPELRQATILAVAHVLLFLQTLNGDMRWHGDNTQEKFN
jgi:hypothetical protein